MRLKFYFIIFFNIFNCSYSTGVTECCNVTSLSEVIQALQAHLGVNSIIILQHNATEKWLQLTTDLIKNLKSAKPYMFFTSYDLETFAIVSDFECHYMSTVVSIYPESLQNDSLKLWFWDEIKLRMNRFFWLTITEDQDYFSDIYVPFDGQFLLLEKLNEEVFLINEIYRTSFTSQLYNNRLGNWSTTYGLQITDVIFDVRRSNLHGQNLTVFGELGSTDDLFVEIGETLYKDAAIDISKKLNFSVTFLEEDLGDNWDLNINPNRVIPGQNLAPAYKFSYDLFFKIKQRSLEWNSYLKPFHELTWLSILGLIVVSSICLFFVYLSLDSNDQTINSKKRHYIMTQFVTDLLDVEERPPTYVSSTLIIATRLIAKVIFLSAYSAIFMSFITVIIMPPPFTTLEGLADSPSYKILAIPDKGYIYYSITESPVIQRLYKKVLPVEQQPVSFGEAFDRLCYEGVDYVTDYPVQLIDDLRISLKDCIISQTSIKLIYGEGCWLTQTNSSHRRIIHLWEYRLTESGSLDDAMWWKTSSHRKNPDLPSSRPIDLFDCAFLFVVLLFGMFASVIVAIIEKKTFRNKKQKKNKNMRVYFL